jgi:hypothetical protein
LPRGHAPSGNQSSESACAKFGAALRIAIPKIADDRGTFAQGRTSAAMHYGETMESLLSRSRPTRRGRMLIRMIIDEFDKNAKSPARAANDAAARHEIRPPKSAPNPRLEPTTPRTGNPSLN